MIKHMLIKEQTKPNIYFFNFGAKISVTGPFCSSEYYWRAFRKNIGRHLHVDAPTIVAKYINRYAQEYLC
ncbi:MAG: hypothetical protein O2897_06425 [bacterium]|nr:hypothetical protein [bacterium]